MSLVVHSWDGFAVIGADDDPWCGAFGALIGPMSLVVHSWDGFAVSGADDETRTRNILLGRQRL